MLSRRVKAVGGWRSKIENRKIVKNRGHPIVPLYALLILHGELDDWHLASRCTIIEGRSKHEIILKIYPGAYLCFTMEGMDTTLNGHRLLYDPVATADAIKRVRNFLARHIK